MLWHEMLLTMGNILGTCWGICMMISYLFDVYWGVRWRAMYKARGVFIYDYDTWMMFPEPKLEVNNRGMKGPTNETDVFLWIDCEITCGRSNRKRAELPMWKSLSKYPSCLNFTLWMINTECIDLRLRLLFADSFFYNHVCKHSVFYVLFAENKWHKNTRS